MSRKLIFSPEAKDDLQSLLDYIAERSGRSTARSYLDRIGSFCMQLRDFPERGALREDLTPGLRVVGFERRISIAFHVEPQRVVIDRVLYGGRDLPRIFRRK